MLSSSSMLSLLLAKHTRQWGWSGVSSLESLPYWTACDCFDLGPLWLFFLTDKISSTNPRVIEDVRARKLCVDVRHSVFYETCATYGLNVDRVFAEGEERPSGDSSYSEEKGNAYYI